MINIIVACILGILLFIGLVLLGGAVIEMEQHSRCIEDGNLWVQISRDHFKCVPK